MFRSWSVRTVLVLLLITGVVAILWSYLSRRDQNRGNQFGHLLSSGISRLSKEFEYSQLKGGKELFRVRASTNTLLKEAVQILEDVDMVRFDPNGTATDAVESRNAVYLISEKQIEFQDDVKIHLAGGSRVFANHAAADLASEQITIAGTFQFEQGGIRGDGNALTYSIPAKTIEISGGSRVAFTLGTGDGSARADAVVYSSEGEQVVLRGNATIRTETYQLTADEIQVLLNPSQEVSQIRSVGNAHLSTGEAQQFVGSVIEIGLDPDTGAPTRFEVLSGKSESLELATRAVFSESTEQGDHRLESSRMEGHITELPEGKGFALRELTAVDDVVLRSSRLGIETCRALFFRARFADSHQGFEGITLSGDVFLVRRPFPLQPSHQEVLRSQDLEIYLGPEQRLEKIQALGEVELEFSREGVYRHLSARDSVELTYEDGWLNRAEASEDCILRSILEEGRNMVRAPLLNADFAEGQVKKVWASGGVDLEIVEGVESVRQTKSEQLELTYLDGCIVEASQWGDFHFWDRTSATATELVSGQAVYDPVQGVITASGEAESVLRSFDSGSDSASDGQSETYAREFVLNQKSNRILALKEVESVIRQNGEPLVLTSGRMEIELDSGWICYSESPRLIQGTNLITGKSICINNARKELNVEEDVTSLLVESEESGGRKYEIKADQLSYKKGNSKVTYNKDVSVTSEDMNLSASMVEFIFASEDLGELDRIEASGGVVIVEKGRTWKGRKAVYYRASERVVVRND